MPTNAEIVALCADIYSQPSIFDKVVDVGNVFLGIKEDADSYTIVARGSYTLLDWIRDLEAISLADTGELGLVPYGFYKGTQDACLALQLHNVHKPIYFGGHSLGAAHALLIGGKLIAAGGRVAKAVLCGCPTPGGEKLKYLWSGTEIDSYRNMNDPVTYLPKLGSLVDCRDFISVLGAPSRPDPYGIFAAHRIKYYIQGVQNYAG